MYRDMMITKTQPFLYVISFIQWPIETAQFGFTKRIIEFIETFVRF